MGARDVPADLLEPGRRLPSTSSSGARRRGASILSRSRELLPEEAGRGRAFAHALLADGQVLARALSRW
jgi:hypothetical protein